MQGSHGRPGCFGSRVSSQKLCQLSFARITPKCLLAVVAALLSPTAPLQAYQGAVQTLGAVADRLRASTGRFFFGDKPSSLDALLFGHLAFYKHSPVAAPVLRDKVGAVLCWPVLRYVVLCAGGAFKACVLQCRDGGVLCQAERLFLGCH